jgi:hypothetical protein
MAAALCGTVVVAGWVVIGVAGFGLPGSKNTDAAPIEDHRAPPLSVDAKPVDALQATAMAKAGVSPAPVTAEAEAIVEAALPDPSQMLAPETPPVQIAMVSTPDMLAPETSHAQIAMVSTPDPVHTDAKEAVSSTETLDECLVPEVCIDQYLWSVYQRTAKLDTVKVVEQRKVIVKKNGKTRTVIKEFTKLVDEDFTWKDPKAAEKAGMSLMEYVIGGMDRSFKVKLYHALRALDDAGLSPGITSAFRDDYRQALASGLKAATDRSYHGGTFRGGYGHGLAADVVSVKGETRVERWISSEICGNGSTRAAGSLESGDRILIKIQPM